MASSARRVGTARLRAADPELIRRGAILLEDGLRTASFPGGDGPGICFVRRLTLGAIRGDGPPSSVALAIGDQLRRLGAMAADGSAGPAADAPIVFFRDPVQPLTVLAQRLSLGRQAREWFWPLAVPGWTPGLASAPAWRVLIAAAARAPAAAAALVEVARAVAEARGLDALAEALAPDEAARLIVACGWELPPALPEALLPGPGAAALPALPRTWSAPIARLARRWGGEDRRVVWLAAVALAAQRPARLADRRLPARAVRVAHALARAATVAPAALSAQPPSWSSQEVAAPAVARAAQRPPPPRDGRWERGPAARDPADEPSRPRLPASARPDGPAHDRDDAPAASVDPLPAAPPDAGGLGELTATEWGGLYFLLHALRGLGLAELVREQPEWAEHALAARVLLAIGAQIGIDAGDPVLAPARQLVGDVEDAGGGGGRAGAGGPALPPFVAPASWLPVIDDGPLALGRGGAGARRIEDAGGLTLALWSGARPAAACALAAGRRVRRAAPSARPPEITVVIEAWTGALARLCQRVLAMSLEGIARRRARIAATRAHLDVVFPLDDVDVALRLAGLDINPGWLPWFGRVVAFHYADGGEVA